MRYISAVCLTIMLIPVLTGCAPTLPPEAVQSPVISKEESRERFTVDNEWWKLYRIPELNRTVEMALARNTDLAKAALKVNRALYQAKLIGADLYPSFDASGAAGSKRDISRDAPSNRDFSGSFGIGYEIDLWQRIVLSASAGEWEYAATEEDLESARLSLINNTVDAWFKLHYLAQSVGMIEKDVDRYERLYSIVRAKYDAGKAASLEPMLERQSLIAAQNKLISARTRYAETTQLLRDLLDLRPGDPLPSADVNMADIPFAPVNLDIPITALAARPDITAAEARLNADFWSLKAQNREWFPKISIGSTLSVSSDSTSTFFDVPMLSGLIKVSFPFLDWNTLRWQTKISETEFEEAKLNFTSSVTKALNEVDTAYIAYANARRLLKQAEEKTAVDRRIAEYYERRYNSGAAEFKDYVSALNTANVSAQALIEAKYNALSLENTVFKAMGGCCGIHN